MTTRNFIAGETAELCIDLLSGITGAGPLSRFAFKRAIRKALKPRIQGVPVEDEAHFVINENIERWVLKWADFHRFETPGMKQVLSRPDANPIELELGVYCCHLLDVSGEPETWKHVVEGRGVLPRHKTKGRLCDMPDPAMWQVCRAPYLEASRLNKPIYDFIRQGELLYRRLIVPVVGHEGDVRHLIVATAVEHLPKWESWLARLLKMLGRC